MTKVLIAIVGLVAVIILALALPGITDAVESFRTNVETEYFSVNTGVGTTTGTIGLDYALWNNSVTSISRVSSNTTLDSPIAANYTAASKAVGISGLAANTTRTITVDYQTAGLADYSGADTGSTAIPGIVVGFFILIPVALLLYILIR